MAWVWLGIAGLCEVAWAIGLKFTEGFSRPVGTAYAVWTGIGAAGTATLGMYLFDEPVTAPRIACLTLIVAGIVGLKLAS